MGYGCYIKGGTIYTSKENSDKMDKLLTKANIDHEVQEGIFKIFGCGYQNYHEADYQEIASIARAGSHLQFIGEDNSVWTLHLAEGKIEDRPGMLVFDTAEQNKFSIELDNGYSMIAEKNPDSDYNEIYVYLSKSGVATQDLAIVSERYGYDDENGNVVPIRGIYDVKVYADPMDENYTDQFIFGRYEEEE